MGNFICQRCGRCCGPVYFNKVEYKTIQRHANNMGITMVKGKIGESIFYLPRTLSRKLLLPKEEVARLIETGGLDCPFLGKDKEGNSLCRIYDQRPEVCRLFGSHPELDRRMKCPKQKEVRRNHDKHIAK
jgi:Fe-S-cluster containining protein